MVLVLIPNLVYSNKRGSMETIYLAGGCYWGLEELIRNIPGVEETQVGFSGGHIKNVTYKEVSSGESGHAESIKVIFNNEILTTWKELLTYFISSSITKNGRDDILNYIIDTNKSLKID